MIEKQTVLDRIEIAADGHVRVHLALLLVEDGVEIMRRSHGALIEPGADVEKTLAAVDADLASPDGLRAAPIDTEMAPLLKSICDLVHTPEVVKKYDAARSDAIAAAGQAIKAK